MIYIDFHQFRLFFFDFIDLYWPSHIVKDFKIVNAPGVVKLLSLADFGGLADLAEGEGLSFETLEINMNNQKGFLKLDEIYILSANNLK